MNLPIQITFKNFSEEGLEDYVREQASKLERYYRGIMSCDVLVETRGRHKEGNPYHVRIRLGVPDRELIVKHEPSIHATLQQEKTVRATKSGETRRPKTPRRAILDAFAEMRRKLEDYARDRRGQTKRPAESLTSGTVARLFPDENYGFLTAADDSNVYFHRNSVLDEGFGRLRVGSRVRFTAELGDKGPQATSVSIVHPRKQARAAAATAVTRRPANRT